MKQRRASQSPLRIHSVQLGVVKEQQRLRVPSVGRGQPNAHPHPLHGSSILLRGAYQWLLGKFPVDAVHTGPCTRSSDCGRMSESDLACENGCLLPCTMAKAWKVSKRLACDLHLGFLWLVATCSCPQHGQRDILAEHQLPFAR